MAIHTNIKSVDFFYIYKTHVFTLIPLHATTSIIFSYERYTKKKKKKKKKKKQ